MHPNASAQFRANVAAASLYDYAGQIVWNLPAPRTDYYIDANFETIRGGIIPWTSEVCESTNAPFFIGFSFVVVLRKTRSDALVSGLGLVSHRIYGH